MTRHEQLDLVEPARLGRRFVQENMVMPRVVEKLLDRLRRVRRKVVDDALELEFP